METLLIKHSVYLTENMVNNKYYVGVRSTSKQNDRYLGSGLLLRRAIKIYGKNSFRRTDIAFFDSRCAAYEFERFLLSSLNDSQCYNIARGGWGGWHHVNDRLTKDDRSQKMLGILNPMYGKKHSKETRFKIGNVKRGVRLGKRKVSNIALVRSKQIKAYEVVNPFGDSYQVDDLPKFCESYDVSYKLMSKLSRKLDPVCRRGTYKGWQCRRAD